MEKEEKGFKAPNPALVRFDNAIFNVMKWISYISAICLLIITLLSTADVVASKFFRHGITNATDIVTYLNIPVVFLSAAYVQLERGHTHIDLIYTHFPRWGQKIVHTVGNILGAGVSAFIGYRAVLFTVQKLQILEKSSSAASAFVTWPFAALIALGFLLMAVAFLWSLVREFVLPPRMEFDMVAASEGEPGKGGQA
jgi:TRAP-type mannitol/chloroaromatic compound transport system permease small subunit